MRVQNWYKYIVTLRLHSFICNFYHKFTRRLSTSEILLCLNYAVCGERILLVNIDLECAALNQSKDLVSIVKAFLRSHTVIFTANSYFPTRFSKQSIHKGFR